MLILETLHSMAKVYADCRTAPDAHISSATMLQNDVYSFQIAYRLSDDAQREITVSCDADLDGRVTMRAVDYEPCDMPMFTGHGGVCDRYAPGLFPDILRPMPKYLWAYGRMTRSVWVTVDCSEKPLAPGEYKLSFAFSDSDGASDVAFTVTVLPAMLPPQKIPVTNWLHCDGICEYYGVPFGSDEFRRILKAFVSCAVKNGINTLLTPVFTPPLDTEIGGERMKTQLVGVAADGGNYSFDFTRLREWIADALSCGVGYFEISHLFTQWGCRHAPNIYAVNDGAEGRIFGWETDALGDGYRAFLAAFLPALADELKSLGVYDRCFFHLSDEPGADAADTYESCSRFVREYIDGDRIIDAMSDVGFYRRGLLSRPIASLNAIHGFIDEGVPDLWGYYCCGEIDTPNRFLAVPAARNRALGALLFRYDIKGFLQWGFNFYNSHLSRAAIDPFATSTAGGWVPGGDAFVVYPGKDGQPVESARLVVFADALRDMRALSALAERFTRERIISALGLKNMTFTDFPTEPYALLALRERVNKMLAEE